VRVDPSKVGGTLKVEDSEFPELAPADYMIGNSSLSIIMAGKELDKWLYATRRRRRDTRCIWRRTLEVKAWLNPRASARAWISTLTLMSPTSPKRARGAY
jgi:hypothetical protein